jgi:hypothetical protein
MTLDSVNRFVPLFVFIFWTLSASVFRVGYSSWTGKRWSYGPGTSMVLLPAISFLMLFIGLKVMDIAPGLGAWIIIGLHILFAVCVAATLIWRKLSKSKHS